MIEPRPRLLEGGSSLDLVAAADSAVVPAGRNFPTAVAATDRVDGILRQLHQRRVDELGADSSGLFDHYKRLLDAGRIAGASVSALAQIVQSLPQFDTYHVLRAGLGELAFVLAAMGLRTVAYESNSQRFDAVEAGLRELTETAPDIAERLAIGRDGIPVAPPGNNVLCIATHVMGYSAENEENALAELSCYGALLIEPRIFLRLRRTLEEQEAAVEAVRRRGFTVIREFSRLGVVYCAKPEVAPIPTVTVRSQFPAVANIVDALKTLSIEETGRHNVRLGSVGIRDYPFPFASALAIAPGVAWQSRAHFRQLREFLCGATETAFGPGLGLEIGGAFTLSRNGGVVAAGFGAEVPGEPQAVARDEALLIELGGTGWNLSGGACRD